MKTRNGFVSNSSSSSFLVIFPKKPSSADRTLKYMFNGVDKDITIYDHHASTTEICDTVFKDLKPKRIEKKSTLVEFFAHSLHHTLYYVEEAVRRDDMQKIIDLSRECGDSFDKYFVLVDLIRAEIAYDKNYYDNYHTINNLIDVSEKSNADEKVIKAYRKQLNKLVSWYQTEDYKKKDSIIKDIAEKKADKFINDHKGFWYTILEYADGDGAAIDFEEDPPDQTYNGVIHRHPAGCKGFSGTDAMHINRNFEFSLLYEGNDIIAGIINIQLTDSRLQLPLKIELVYPVFNIDNTDVILQKIQYYQMMHGYTNEETREDIIKKYETYDKFMDAIVKWKEAKENEK